MCDSESDNDMIIDYKEIDDFKLQDSAMRSRTGEAKWRG